MFDSITELAVIFYGYFTHLAVKSNNDGNDLVSGSATPPNTYLFPLSIHLPHLIPTQMTSSSLPSWYCLETIISSGGSMSEMEPPHSRHLFFSTYPQTRLTDNTLLPPSPLPAKSSRCPQHPVISIKSKLHIVVEWSFLSRAKEVGILFVVVSNTLSQHHVSLSEM